MNRPPWCPYCRRPSGPDCPRVLDDRRAARRRLKRALRRDPEHQ